MKICNLLIAILHFFVGTGALAGGIAGIRDPISPFGIPANALKTGPFSDFFIPSLFLLIVLGLGNIGCGIATVRKIRLYEYTSGVMAVILVVWIIIQCYVMQNIVFIQALYFIIGTVQGILCLIVLWNKNLFPANWARKIFSI